MPPALTGRARSEGRSRPLASAWNQNQLVVDPYDRVSLLALEPHPRLLEFGCGPGLALDSILPAAGIAVALDHSPQMIRMAQKRHAGAVREERLQLILADVIEFARCYSVEGFDRLFSSNVVQFWPDLEVGFRALEPLLRPGGSIVTNDMSRGDGPSSEKTRSTAAAIARAQERAGFSPVRIEFLETEPIVAAQ